MLTWPTDFSLSELDSSFTDFFYPGKKIYQQDRFVDGKTLIRQQNIKTTTKKNNDIILKKNHKKDSINKNNNDIIVKINYINNNIINKNENNLINSNPQNNNNNNNDNNNNDYNNNNNNNKSNNNNANKMFRKFSKAPKQSDEAKKRQERQMYLAKEDPHPSIDLSSCELTQFPEGLFSLTKILRKETLVVSSNMISKFDSGGKNGTCSRCFCH